MYAVWLHSWFCILFSKNKGGGKYIRYSVCTLYSVTASYWVFITYTNYFDPADRFASHLRNAFQVLCGPNDILMIYYP